LAGLRKVSFEDLRFLEKTDRPPFDHDVEAALALKDGQARCHSLSYKYLHLWVQEIYKSGKDGKTIKGQLEKLIAAVFRAGDPHFNPANPAAWSDVGVVQPGFANAYAAHFSRAQRAADPDGLTKELNNSVANLRVAYQSWNASIQDCFDPILWLHLDGFGNVDASMEGLYANPQPPDPGIGIPLQSKDAFFLINPSDGIQISRMANEVNLAVTPINVIANKVTGLDGRRYHIIFSSSNCFGIASQGILPSAHAIFYRGYGTNTWAKV
jgi:hypothetical protein